MGKPRPIQLFTDLTTIQEETGGGKEEADADKVAFPTIEHVADMEARRSTSRRSSDSDSLNSSYKILPPIKKPLEPEEHPKILEMSIVIRLIRHILETK